MSSRLRLVKRLCCRLVARAACSSAGYSCTHTQKYPAPCPECASGPSAAPAAGGIYSAYRLLSGVTPKPTVCVFEMTKRLGGRCVCVCVSSAPRSVQPIKKQASACPAPNIGQVVAAGGCGARPCILAATNPSPHNMRAHAHTNPEGSERGPRFCMAWSTLHPLPRLTHTHEATCLLVAP